MFKAHFVKFLPLLFLLVTLSACSSSSSSSSSSPEESQPKLSAKLIKPVDNAELLSWLKAELAKSYEYRDIRYYYSYLSSGTTAEVSATTPSNNSTAGTTYNPQASDSNKEYSSSTTNIQEKGVDEGDLVKNSGGYIYLARGTHFLILKGQPPESAAVISDIDLKETVSELHLTGNRITVITAPYSVGILANDLPTPVGATRAGGVSTTKKSASAVTTTDIKAPLIATIRVYNYDVSNPNAPELLSKLEFPGYLQGSRRINNTIYLITNHHIDLLTPVSAYDYMHSGDYSPEFYNQASKMASAENLRRIENLTIEEMIPKYSSTIYSNGVAGATNTFPVVSSSNVYIPETANGTDLSMVIAFDPVAAEPAVASSSVISSWCQIYMSPETLYLASSNSWSWIEPMQGIIAPTGNSEPWTALHKFALLSGSGTPLYKGSGIVNGWLNNQFSMGEYNSYLRIGTTRGGWWGEGISNRLAIIAEENGSLVEKGRIEGLAVGEKIYSMRFDRNRGYMVTFRQTDPLFTFDLTDPLNPLKAGELKVNGFATYIHLMGNDNNKLLTIGESADSTGRVTGNKLQLFDVTNLSAPALIGEYELGNGWSDAIYDYHAFLYYEPLDLLAIPYNSYDNSIGEYSSGLKLFNINESGIALKGMIPAQAVSNPNYVYYGYGSYADTVDRSVIIGTDIYAIAQRTLTVAGIENLDIKRVVTLY